MDAILIFLTSLGAAYLANRLARRGPFTQADLAIGIIGGLIGLGLAQFLSIEGAEWNLGLPLLLAGCLAIGLESLQGRSFSR
jgi:hypothetical protein